MKRKKALITGASHGIGKAIAIALAQNGYDVGVNYCNNRTGAEDTCRLAREAGAQALAFRADVGDYQALRGLFDAYFDAFGSIDLMVNNAGVSEFHPLLEVTEEQWERITRTDWKAAYFGTQFAARRMVEQGTAGVIINIASNHVDGCFPEANIYAPSKAAVDTFCRNAAMELAPHKIRVLALAPGYTNVWEPDNPINQVKERIPLQRFATPQEVANILVFIASDACSYMTGTRITVDGGALLPVVPENTFNGGALLPLKIHETGVSE